MPTEYVTVPQAELDRQRKTLDAYLFFQGWVKSALEPRGRTPESQLESIQEGLLILQGNLEAIREEEHT